MCFYLALLRDPSLCKKVLYGSVMQLLVHDIMPDPTADENLKVLWREMKQQYDAFKINSRFGQMKMSMFNPKGRASLPKNMKLIRSEILVHPYSPLRKCRARSKNALH